MAAELFIKTTKAEYKAGDTVYGAIYLKVSGPTSAYGVSLRFYGSESFSYGGSSSSCKSLGTLDRIRDSTCAIQDIKHYMSCENIKLYEFDGPIALGKYVFPFCQRLPDDLPNSTELRWSSGKAEVAYRIEASLLGAEAFLALQKIVVVQAQTACLASSVSGNAGGQPIRETKVVEVRSAIPFVTTQFVIVASIDKFYYHSGENLKLRLRLEVNGVMKPRILHLAFQLLRETELRSSHVDPQKALLGVGSKTKPTWSRSFGSLAPPRHSNIESSTSPSPVEYYYPEQQADGMAAIVWDSGRLYDKDGTILLKGIDELLIPLRDADRQDLPATTSGSLITLLYSLRIEIAVHRNEPIVLNLPVSSVSQRAAKLPQTKNADWLQDCQLMTSVNSKCRVPDSVLHGMEYVNLPGFHVDHT